MEDYVLSPCRIMMTDRQHIYLLLSLDSIGLSSFIVVRMVQQHIQIILNNVITVCLLFFFRQYTH